MQNVCIFLLMRYNDGMEKYENSYNVLKTSYDRFFNISENEKSLSSCCKTKSTQYSSGQEYLDNIIQFTHNNKIKLIIEFHVMNPQRYEDFTILTNQGFSINNNFELMSIFIKTLILNKFTNFSLDYPFNALNLNSSVSSIYKQTQISSLQFIINQRIFDSKRKTDRLLKTMADIIKKINYMQ